MQLILKSQILLPFDVYVYTRHGERNVSESSAIHGLPRIYSVRNDKEEKIVCLV